MKNVKLLLHLFGIISFQFIFSQNTVSYSPASITVSANSGVEVLVPITVSCSGNNSTMLTNVQPANTCSSTDGWIGMEYTNGLTAITPGNSTIIKFRFKKTVSSNTTIIYKFSNNGSCTSPQISITVNYIAGIVAPVICSLPAPTGLSVSSIQSNSVYCSWNNVPNVNQYLIELSRLDGLPSGFNNGLYSNNLTISSLMPGITYKLKVYSYCGGTITQNTPSTQITFTTILCPSSIPTNLNATPYNGNWTISFTPVIGISSYTMEYVDLDNPSVTGVTQITYSSTPNYSSNFFYYIPSYHSFKFRFLQLCNMNTEWVTIPSACSLPSVTNLLVNSFSGSGTFNWSAISNSYGYQGEYIIYNLLGQQVSGIFSITSNSYSTIINTSSITGTKYIKFRIKSKCFGGVWSDFSGWSTPNVWN